MKTDFQRYQEIQSQMRAMIRAGQYNYQTFDDLWHESNEIINRHGGFPPLPDDEQALELWACETANMQGLR